MNLVANITELSGGLALILGISVFLMIVVGRRIGRRRFVADPDGSHAGVGAVEGAVFGLLGLMIAFTFAGAASRYDARRALIVQEANDIGTAWLRVDTLPESMQAPVREAFRRYLDARLATYTSLPDIAAALAEDTKARQAQDDIWRLALPATVAQGASPAAPLLVVPALNTMFDIAETRRQAMRHHPPTVVFGMLIVFALVGALLVGDGMARTSRISVTHAVGFALVLATTVFVILDIEYPRVGFVRLDAADQVLIDLRRSMN